MSLLNSLSRFESPLDHAMAVDLSADLTTSHSASGVVYSVLDGPTNGERPTRKKPAEPAPSHFSPWLISLAYPLGRYVVLPNYFGSIQVVGQENLPHLGPVILAPTHRSRWDALTVPFAAGHHVTGRHLRYMVSADEVTGVQGWFIQRMGGFPINTNRPAIASLRHGVDLLEQGEVLVIFPEGNIFREEHVQPLKPGLARLAIQAEILKPGLGINIVPMSICYDKPGVSWGTKVKIAIGRPIAVPGFCTGASKQDARVLTATLQGAMEQLQQQTVF